MTSKVSPSAELEPLLADHLNSNDKFNDTMSPSCAPIDLIDIALKNVYPDTVKDVVTWPSAVLSRYLKEECAESPPNLEAMLKWAKVNNVAPIINPKDYTFVSHMHDAAFPNKLGAGQMDAICSIPGNIWLDLTSMYQGCWDGYVYIRHTKPVVERLHVIMLESSQQAVVLSGYDTDPMGLKRKISLALGDCRAALAVDTFPTLYQTVCGADSSEFVNTIASISAQLETVELPVDKYFSRLWCYVERLAVRDAVPHYVLNGKGGRDMGPFVDLMERALADLKKIAGHLDIASTATITVFNPKRFKNRHIVYAMNNFSRTLSTLRKLWGVHIDAGATAADEVLDPWSNIETLDCYCSADRVTVYEIECSIRGVTPNTVDYCFCLQLALGCQPVALGSLLDFMADETKAQCCTLLESCPEATRTPYAALVRASFGLARKISAVDLAVARHPESLLTALKSIVADGSLAFRWLDHAHRNGNINMRLNFWSLVKLRRHCCYVIHKKHKRYFELRFDGQQYRLGAMAETSVPDTWPLPKTFNPMTSAGPIFKIERRFRESQRSLAIR
jgi:hypothetical protein